jgi:transcription antitermination protein NusB
LRPDMTGRRKIRELAMQVLFSWDTHGSSDHDLATQIAADATDDDAIRREGIAMAAGTWDARQTSDEWVERLAPQWPPRRQPVVDRNIIRLAIYEMTHTQTPPKVVIDEAIELAKTFSTEQSPSFVNGVLDAVLKERNALTGDTQNADQKTQNVDGHPPMP